MNPRKVTPIHEAKNSHPSGGGARSRRIDGRSCRSGRVRQLHQPDRHLNYLTNNFKKEILEAVDERINAKIAEISDKLAESRPAEQAEPVNQPEPEPVVVTQPAPSSAYEVVQLSNGDALYAEASCEVILRAGYAVCIAPDPTQGLADTTNGYEIYNGQALTKNHTCLIPRADGRGQKLPQTPR